MSNDTTTMVYLPPGHISIALGGKTYPAADDGSVEIPQKDVPTALSHGAHRTPLATKPAVAGVDPVSTLHAMVATLQSRVSVLESTTQQLGSIRTRISALEKAGRK